MVLPRVFGFLGGTKGVSEAGSHPAQKASSEVFDRSAWQAACDPNSPTFNRDAWQAASDEVAALKRGGADDLNPAKTMVARKPHGFYFSEALAGVGMKLYNGFVKTSGSRFSEGTFGIIFLASLGLGLSLDAFIHPIEMAGVLKKEWTRVMGQRPENKAD